MNGTELRFVSMLTRQSAATTPRQAVPRSRNARPAAAGTRTVRSRSEAGPQAARASCRAPLELPVEIAGGVEPLGAPELPSGSSGARGASCGIIAIMRWIGKGGREVHPRFARRGHLLSRLTDILSWVLLSVVLLSVATGQLPSSAPLFAAQPSQTHERDAAEQDADLQEPDTPCTGWVYVGPAHDDSQWAFSVEQPTRSSSAIQEHAARAGEKTGETNQYLDPREAAYVASRGPL